jgi:hypothetical protein
MSEPFAIGGIFSHRVTLVPFLQVGVWMQLPVFSFLRHTLCELDLSIAWWESAC